MLTNRQRLALSLIGYWVRETGKYPDYKRLGELLGNDQRGNGWRLVRQLSDRGYLTIADKGYRFNSEKVALFRMFRLDELTGEFQDMGLYLIEVRPPVGAGIAKSPAVAREALVG